MAGARVLVAGAGAIGNEVAKNLALLGVGRLLIVDRDVVESTNLVKSVLFSAADVGASKAVALAAAAKRLNPDIDAIPIEGDIALDVGLGTLRRVDVVVGALDNREARVSLNRKCRRVGVPWVDAGIGELNVRVAVFAGSRGPCFECGMTEEDYAQIAVSCSTILSMNAQRGSVATTPAAAAIAGGVQAQEVLKLLQAEWDGGSLEGREFLYNGTSASTTIVDLPLRPGCPAHSSIDPDRIVPWDGSARSTVGELLAFGEELLGSKQVELVLGYEIAYERRCTICGVVEQIHSPIAKTYTETLQCDSCGGVGHASTAHLLSSSNRSTEFLLDLRLCDIGVPPLEILELRGHGGRFVYIELAADTQV